MRALLWIALGAAAVWIYMNRKTISDVWTHRKEVSAGSKVVTGAESVIAGAKDLLKELD